jgi:hypothetical protein
MASRARLIAQQRIETCAMTSRIAGGACLVLGLVPLCLLGNLAKSREATFAILIYFGALTLIFYGPAIAYLLLAGRAKAGAPWAIITTLVVASVHAAIMLLVLAGAFLIFYISVLLVGGMLFLLLVLLIVHAAQALQATRTLGPPAAGFEPLIAQTKSPAAPTPPPAPRAPDDGGWPDIR